MSSLHCSPAGWLSFQRPPSLSTPGTPGGAGYCSGAAIVCLGWGGVNGALVAPEENPARAVLPALAGWPLLGEAITAVDRPILAGPKGDLAR